jgi:hypothetical protein
VSVDKYRLLLASDVGDRDGIGLELVGLNGDRLAEVFQDDTTGERTVSIFGDRRLPLADFEWFLRQATENL